MRQKGRCALGFKWHKQKGLSAQHWLEVRVGGMFIYTHDFFVPFQLLTSYFPFTTKPLQETLDKSEDKKYTSNWKLKT